MKVNIVGSESSNCWRLLSYEASAATWDTETERREKEKKKEEARGRTSCLGEIFNGNLNLLFQKIPYMKAERKVGKCMDCIIMLVFFGFWFLVFVTSSTALPDVIQS